ncbi:hypothetical protein, conserved, partial [Eimeria maxima]
RSGQPMTEGRTRRLQKLQQLWAQVVSSVEAERRVRTADVSSVASVDPRSSSSSTLPNGRCLQQRLSHGERIPEDEERRYYCPELCNTGIFRHPDGSIRPYPPAVANDKSEQRRRFVETQQRRMRDRRGPSRHSDMSSDSESEDEPTAGTNSSSSSSKKTPGADTAPSGEATEDFLASIPLPAEPPPPSAACSSPVPTAAAQQQTKQAMPAPPSMPLVPLPFPAPPLAGYGGTSQAPAAGPLQGPPFYGIPAPPSQLVAHMQQMQQQQPDQQRVSSNPQQGPLPPQQASGAAGPTNVQKRPPQHQTPPVPAKKQQADKPAGGSDLKAAMTFVPTHLRTKKLPATAKTNEGPSISRVSAYSMGNTALGRQGGVGGASGERGQVSGLAKFLGEAKKQHGDGGVVGGSSKTPAPADLDRAFDEFLKEVGAS